MAAACAEDAESIDSEETVSFNVNLAVADNV